MPNRIADLDHAYGATFLTNEKLASIWSMLDPEKKGYLTLDDLAARAANKQVLRVEADVQFKFHLCTHFPRTSAMYTV